MYVFTALPPDIKPPDIVKKVGQIWEYRSAPSQKWHVPDNHVGKEDALVLAKCAVKIIGVEPDGSVHVQYIKNNLYKSIALNEVVLLLPHDLANPENDFFRLIMNDLPGPQTCADCSRIYNYANGPNQSNGTFRCWACKNGF